MTDSGYKRLTFATLVKNAALQPWSILTGAFGAGFAWAVNIPVFVALVVGGGMYAIAAVAGALTGSGKPKAKDRKMLLTPGSRWEAALERLELLVGELAKLRNAELSQAVSSQAIEAYVAAKEAKDGAAQVANAIEVLDQAAAKTWKLLEGKDPYGSTHRLYRRRDELVERLERTVSEVAEVYGKLVEVGATIGSAVLVSETSTLEGLTVDLDALRNAVLEMEAAAKSPAP